MKRMCLVLFGIWLTACAHEPRKMPRQRLPTPEATQSGEAAPVPELIEVRVLVVSYQGARGAWPDQTRTKEEALERARMLTRMARSGDRFTELVRKYSDRRNASEDLGLFRLRPAQPGAFGPEVARVAASLRPGAISDPVDAPEGWFIIERRPDPPTGPERIGARHILVSFKGAERAIEGVTRSQAEARALAEQIAKEAQSGESDWNELAARYTDEPGSKETGGDLGHFGRGQMVPSFERAAFALSVGQVSGVVETPYGYHVIQRYD